MPAFTIAEFATPRLRALARLLDSAGRGALAAELATPRLHFLRHDQAGNRRGFSRTHGWLRRARDRTVVRPGLAGIAAVVIDSDPFADKLAGSAILPRAGRRVLALPLPAATPPWAAPGLFVGRAPRTPGLAVPPGGALPDSAELRSALKTRAAAAVAHPRAGPA